MRTINFRGYSKDFTENEWFFGNLIDKGNGSFQILEKNPKIWDLSYDGITVIPESIGQFTGLHDKNGKKIYEGDVLEDTLGRKKLVEYYKDGFWLNASLEGAEWCLRHVNSSSEVIGNIYVNPELLENKLQD